MTASQARVAQLATQLPEKDSRDLCDAEAGLDQAQSCTHCIKHRLTAHYKSGCHCCCLQSTRLKDPTTQEDPMGSSGERSSWSAGKWILKHASKTLPRFTKISPMR